MFLPSLKKKNLWGIRLKVVCVFRGASSVQISALELTMPLAPNVGTCLRNLGPLFGFLI